MAATTRPIRFAAPVERAGWALRGVAATLLCAALCALSAPGTTGPEISPAALVGACGFGLVACRSWLRTLSGRPPIVIDERGISVDAGPLGRWHESWEAVTGVRLRHGLIRSRVVIDVANGSRSRVIPPCCQGGLPPEWLAGVIEAMRERGRATALTSVA